MKFVVSVIAALQAATALAAPSPQTDKSPTAPLKLRAVAPGQPFDGRFLTAKDVNLGIYATKSKTEAFPIYAAEGTGGPNTYSLRKFPKDQDHNELCLLGPPGLHSLVYFFEPRATDPLPPSTLSFGAFTITPAFNELGPAGTRRFLGYRGKSNSRWIAVPTGKGEYDIKYYDGSVIVTQDYIPLRVEVVRS
ncbi:MAG: hypothetical protein M1833_004785 [Piccolia ochrophora]|nr:MAG: hypothetical protein M1833_004785 [Piccolia ochrophora]